MKSVQRLLAMAFALCAWAAAPAFADDDPAAAALEKEANTTVDQAFKDFEAKKYREAAQGFLRAYEMTGGKFPKQLRNAAKAYTTGALYEEAVQVWERLTNLPRADEAVRREAKEQLAAVRGQWSEQLKGQGDAAHKGKQSRAAADAYVRAFRASGRSRGDVLQLAAKDYEAAKRLDDAHLAWTLLERLPGVDATLAKTAREQGARVLDATRGHASANQGLDKLAAGQFADAAGQLLAAFDATRERTHLRLAAHCLEAAEQFDQALATWSRYELHDPTSLLGTDEARARQKALRRTKLKNEAKAAAAASNHAAAGEAWLAMYDVSQERDVAALREAAQAFEQAGATERAVGLWQRLADSPYASDAERAAAVERKAEAGKVRPKPVVVVAVEKPADPGVAVSKGPTVPQPPAPAPVGERMCTACWALVGGGAAVLLGSGTLVYLARDDQSLLLTAVQSKDSDGRIVGITHQEAVSRQERNFTLNSLGVAGTVGGLAAVAGGVLLKLVSGPGASTSRVEPVIELGPGGLVVGARY